MNDKGGLPAIPVYQIERHYFLHAIRGERAKERVHGHKNGNHKAFQRELCKSRREHYGLVKKR